MSLIITAHLNLKWVHGFFGTTKMEPKFNPLPGPLLTLLGPLLTFIYRAIWNEYGQNFLVLSWATQTDPTCTWHIWEFYYHCMFADHWICVCKYLRWVRFWPIHYIHMTTGINQQTYCLHCEAVLGRTKAQFQAIWTFQTIGHLRETNSCRGVVFKSFWRTTNLEVSPAAQT